MKKIDRMREKVTILPTSVYLSKMHDAGWSLVALEWEREVEVSGLPEEPAVPATSEEIPFGLRIASDCRHLEDDPLEIQTLKFLAEMIVQDISFTSMSDALNVREYRTRDGRPWTAAAVFKLIPPPLRRRVGIPQETIDPRHLELLRTRSPYHQSLRW